MELDAITGHIVDAAVKLHQGLGPGLLESVYEVVLARDLARRGLRVERQRVIAFEYDGMRFDEGLRVDLLVEGRVVVELKSVERLLPVHKKQVLTYIRLLELPVGLLINFGAPVLKDGLHRIVHRLPPSSSPGLRINQLAIHGVPTAQPTPMDPSKTPSTSPPVHPSASPSLRVSSSDEPSTAPSLRVDASEDPSASPRLRVDLSDEPSTAPSLRVDLSDEPSAAPSLRVNPTEEPA